MGHAIKNQPMDLLNQPTKQINLSNQFITHRITYHDMSTRETATLDTLSVSVVYPTMETYSIPQHAHLGDTSAHPIRHPQCGNVNSLTVAYQRRKCPFPGNQFPYSISCIPTSASSYLLHQCLCIGFPGKRPSRLFLVSMSTSRLCLANRKHGRWRAPNNPVTLISYPVR